MIKIISDTQKMLLSGSRRFFKTDGFIALTKKIMSVDAFLSRVAESVIYENINLGSSCFSARTQDNRYTLYFCAARGDSRLGSGDIIFYGFETTDGYEGGTDRRLLEYLLSHRRLSIIIENTDKAPAKEDLNKVYLVSSGDGAVNFPLLNETQQRIVATEDANMLVQGVAGSGKTNVCVEKIVYCACRGYRGRVLYTTFSRGLLTETKNRVSLFVKNIEDFISFYEQGRVVFLDKDHKRAVENKLGIIFDTDDDGKMVLSLKRISGFLKEKVDYLLIEDIYNRYFPAQRIFGESEFLNLYIGGKNYKLAGALDKIKNLAPEIIYKEIYGMLLGKYDTDSPSEMMGRDEYIKARSDSFSRQTAETIYAVAADYLQYLQKNNLTDNNLMSRKLIDKIDSPVYSVGIIDEAQDFTQVNLYLIKKLSRKLFCVGDALQMINPSYFNFGYLKRLMYGDVTGINELTHNYRSTQKIENIARKLGEMNVKRFGTHSFVLKGESVASALNSSAVFINDGGFCSLLEDKRFENVTIVVASQRKKEELRKRLKKTEILTVAEAKGLERNTVILADVLSDNLESWQYLKDMTVNRKTADENSVFRYYFNLFYVGISRAKQYLFVCERNYPEMFEELFLECFERKSVKDGLKLLADVAGRIDVDDGELIERIEEFCRLEQYQNARFTADRLSTDTVRDEQLANIYVHENFLRYGRYRDAGVEYWKRGMDKNAREMFTKSGDESLFPLMDACARGGGGLDVDIVKFFPIVQGNDVASRLIIETVKGDLADIVSRQKRINETLKRKKR